MTPPTPDTTVINGRYELQEWLRRTTISDDYLAHDQLLDRIVIFRALHPELTADRSFIERFRYHAQQAANLNHPAIASVFDWGRSPDGIDGQPGPVFYLIAEYVRGRTLTEFVHGNGAMPIDRASHVLTGITSAIAFAHRAGVLHTGLTPDHVTVTSTGVVKVQGLGLDCTLDPSWLPDDSHPELAFWRAPEQFRGDDPTEQTDVYQVGLLAYFLVTGRTPFSGQTAAVVAQRHLGVIPPAPSSANPKVPRAFEAIVGRSMAKPLEERFATVDAQRSAIIRFRESLNAQKARSAPAQPDRPPVEDDATMHVASQERPTRPQERPQNQRSRQAYADETTIEQASGRQRPDDDRTRVQRAPRDVIGAPEGNFDAMHGSRRGRAGYVALLLILLAVLSGLLFLLAKQMGVGTTKQLDITVPSVVGKSSSQAESILSAAGLRVKPITAPNSTVAAEIVWEQTPAAGQVVSSETEVVIRVSSGVGVPTIPDVVGDTVEIARGKLYAAGFPMTIVEEENDSSPAGTVMRQSPEPDSVAEPDVNVTVYVAKSPGTIEIPDVSGQPIDEARLTLTKAGFRVSPQTEASETVDKGMVIRTEPVAGTKVDRATPVIIYVSGGQGIVVPSVIGKSQAEAAKTLSDLGFAVDVTARAVVDKADEGKVVSQSPAAGTEGANGSTVVLRIGQFDPTATTKQARVAAASAETTLAEADGGQVRTNAATTTQAPPEVPVTTAPPAVPVPVEATPQTAVANP